jgi:hypothetical protein
MKEAFELIIERLKLPQGVAKRCLDFKVAKAYGNAIDIVNQVAEEYKTTPKMVVNEEIKNVFANMSTVGCVNCDHKDEYIIELEQGYISQKDCNTCANNTEFDEIDNGCYMCCKGLEDNYQPKGE